MTMHYTIDFSKMPEYAKVTTSGIATIAGFGELLKNLTESPEWLPGTKQLIDHELLDLSQISPQDMDIICSLTMFFAKELGDGRCAFVLQGTSGVLTGDYYTHSQARIPNTAKIFTKIAQAEQWLLDSANNVNH